MVDPEPDPNSSFRFDLRQVFSMAPRQSSAFNADPKVLRNLFLCADGEIPEFDPSLIGEPLVVYNYRAIVSFVAYLALILLPIFPLFCQWRRSSRRFKNETA